MENPTASHAMSERERESMLDLLRAIVQKKIAPRADQHDHEGSFPVDNFQDLHRAGLLGLTIPKEYGGLGGGMGGDHLVFYLSVYEIAKACGSTALSWGHHSYIAGLVNQLGTAEQKQRYFGQVIRDGALFASIGTEPRTDATMQLGTFARRTDGGYIVNGRKRFGSSMGYAAFHMLWTMVEDEPDMRKGLLFPIVEPTNPAVKIIRDWTSMGMRATATDSMEITNCFVPDADILGSPGAYFRLPLQSLLFHTEFAANFIGIASGALEFAVNYLHTQARPWIGSSVQRASEDPYIQYRVGDMYTLREAALALVIRVGTLIQKAQDGGNEEDLTQAGLAAWAAKVMATQVCREITNMAFQVCGSRSTRATYNFDRFWRDATTFALHDPVDYRRKAIGDVVLGVHPFQTSII